LCAKALKRQIIIFQNLNPVIFIFNNFGIFLEVMMSEVSNADKPSSLRHVRRNFTLRKGDAMKNLIVTLMIGISAAQLMGGEKQPAVANPIGATEKDGVATSKAAVPAALVGQWKSGSLAANFYNSSTQQWSEPNGRGMFLILQANGEYRFGAGEEIVTTDYYLYQEGTIAINGAEIVLSPKMGSQFERDVCVHEEDQRASSKDELQAAKLKFQIVLDQGEPNLVLINERGGQVTLRPSAK
jgi:hypothetical protein